MKYVKFPVLFNTPGIIMHQMLPDACIYPFGIIRISDIPSLLPSALSIKLVV